MAKSKSIDKTLSEVEQIARVWTDNPSFALSDITLPQFQTLITELRAQSAKTEDLRTQLTAASNETNSRANDLNALAVRARGGVRAFFGPNSTQYEQVGGKRSSERKRPTRKTKTPKG
ncbi:MAG: hypothetical protein LC754_09935 [Acidobacteria bacterium]|nr:hypothetical protein [Acidobacteriota bacterium]